MIEGDIENRSRLSVDAARFFLVSELKYDEFSVLGTGENFCVARGF